MASEIDDVARTARLHLSENEKRKYSKDLKNILKAFKVLDKAAVARVKPTFQPVEVKNVVREDIVEPSLSQKDALANTKNKEKGYFKGPQAM